MEGLCDKCARQPDVWRGNAINVHGEVLDWGGSAINVPGSVPDGEGGH